jgi:hypothetical protein
MLMLPVCPSVNILQFIDITFLVLLLLLLLLLLFICTQAGILTQCLEAVFYEHSYKLSRIFLRLHQNTHRSIANLVKVTVHLSNQVEEIIEVLHEVIDPEMRVRSWRV